MNSPSRQYRYKIAAIRECLSVTANAAIRNSHIIRLIDLRINCYRPLSSVSTTEVAAVIMEACRSATHTQSMRPIMTCPVRAGLAEWLDFRLHCQRHGYRNLNIIYELYTRSMSYNQRWNEVRGYSS